MRGRYVRVELPGKQRTLTLAEVEVLSDGKNVALKKAASQVNTAHGGAAARAVDGNTTGEYNAGTSTHTQEGTDNAWWEVDLGKEYPVEAVRVYNRTDGALGSRLQNFTLKVLDADGNGYISDVIAAIDYAVAMKDTFNIRVINLSVASGVYVVVHPTVLPATSPAAPFVASAGSSVSVAGSAVV